MCTQREVQRISEKGRDAEKGGRCSQEAAEGQHEGRKTPRAEGSSTAGGGVPPRLSLGVW